jgi:hypothetical protein
MHRIAIPEPDDVGDYYHDGSVNAADYVVWRKSGAPRANYEKWRANFGTILLGSGDGTMSSIPEPSSALLALSIFALQASRRSRRCL